MERHLRDADQGRIYYQKVSELKNKKYERRIERECSWSHVPNQEIKPQQTEVSDEIVWYNNNLIDQENNIPDPYDPLEEMDLGESLSPNEVFERNEIYEPKIPTDREMEQFNKDAQLN
jgi:hypothetical protein